MSSFLVKYISNRIIKGNQWNRFGVEDPYHEFITIGHRSNGEPKVKKIDRRLPEGISVNDLSILQQFKKKAYRYDMWFDLLGVKFGLTNIIGMIPIVGTIISTYWSLQLLLLSRRLDDGFPLDLQLLFLVNVSIDFLLGLIPFVGSLIEIGYKSNSRNYLLLEKHLIRVGQKNRGIITQEDVRPGFINDKVQPYVETKVLPAAGKVAGKAGESIKSFLDHQTKATPTTSTSTTSSRSSVVDIPASAESANTSFSDEKEDRASVKSIRSLIDKKEK